MERHNNWIIEQSKLTGRFNLECSDNIEEYNSKILRAQKRLGRELEWCPLIVFTEKTSKGSFDKACEMLDLLKCGKVKPKELIYAVH